MKKHNISYSKEEHILRKHDFNQDFFEKIDTEAKAYFLGFIIADGSVSDTNNNGVVNRLAINISHKDVEILEMLKKEIEANSTEIEIYTPHESTFSSNLMSRLTLNSVKLCEDLAKLGVVRNKRTKEYMPEINHHLKRHLVRGFFDGDGSVHKDNRGAPIVSFTKSKSMLRNIQEYLIKEINSSRNTSVNSAGIGRNSFNFQLSSIKDSVNFYHLIYDDANFYLNRKYKVFTSLVS